MLVYRELGARPLGEDAGNADRLSAVVIQCKAVVNVLNLLPDD